MYLYTTKSLYSVINEEIKQDNLNELFNKVASNIEKNNINNQYTFGGYQITYSLTDEP